jgi:hypothetical protein
MYSNGTSVVKLSRQHSTTTSDVGESLYEDDLEWDKSDFTAHLSESDALSSYDINEMAEILRNRFLEFDMSSQISEDSTPPRQSTISNIFTSISNQDLTMRQIKRPFHRSLTDFNSIKHKKKSFVLSKHLSLINIQKTDPISTNSRQSFYPIPPSMEPESPRNFSRLSKLEMIRLYLIKLKEKLCSFTFQTFHPTPKMTIITEEIIDTYDIIEE